MGRDCDAGWKMYIADLFVGVACFRRSDQPWFICDFEPTAAFDEYRHIFDKYAELVNNPKPNDMDYSDFYEMYIARLKIRLEPFGDANGDPVYVTQIYSHTNEIWLRPLEK